MTGGVWRIVDGKKVAATRDDTKKKPAKKPKKE